MTNAKRKTVGFVLCWVLFLGGFAPVMIVAAATPTPLSTETVQPTLTPYMPDLDSCLSTSVIPTVEAFFTPTEGATVTPCPTDDGEGCAGGHSGGGATSTPSPTPAASPTPHVGGGCGEGIVVTTGWAGQVHPDPWYTTSGSSFVCEQASESTWVCEGGFGVETHTDPNHGSYGWVWFDIYVPEDTEIWISTDLETSSWIDGSGGGGLSGAIPPGGADWFSFYAGTDFILHHAWSSSFFEASGGGYRRVYLWTFSGGEATPLPRVATIAGTITFSMGEECLIDELPPTPGLCDGYTMDGDVEPGDPIATFNPPHIEHGECYWVMLPNTIDLPDLSWSPFDLPSEVDVYGWQVCLDFYVMSAKFVGMDWIAILAGIISFICIAGAYMTLKNMN